MARIDEQERDLANLPPLVQEEGAAESLPPVVVTDPPAAPPPTPGIVQPVITAKRPAPAKFRIRISPELEAAEERLTPAKIKSWSTSLVLHAVLLCLLALVFFRPATRSTPVIETALTAGDLFGSDFGQQLTGGEGLDEPLSMPYEQDKSPVDPPELTDSTTQEPSLLIPERTRVPDPESSASGGGVDLTGSGQAGKGDGFGVAKFGLGGKESINNVEVKTGNPQFTLIWNSTADLDLHVLEPGGSHLYWENRHGTQGGELDVDDIDGMGPENIYWGGGLNQGNGPPGEYRWYVHYFGGIDGNQPTKWRVRLKYNGTYKVFEGKLNAIGQRTKTWSFKIDKSDSDPEPAIKVSDDGAKSPMPPGGRQLRPLAGEPVPFENPTSMLSGGLGRARAGVDQVVDDGGETSAAAGPNRTRPGSAPKHAGTTPKPAKEPAAGPEVAATPGESSKKETQPASRRRTAFEKDPSGWVRVRPVDVGFSFLMPEEPAEELQVLEHRPGEPEIRLWKLNRGEGEFSCAMTPLPLAPTQAAAGPLLDREARAQVAESGGSEVVTAEGRNGKIAERNTRFKVPDKVVAGGGLSRIRLLVHGSQLIRFSVTGTEEFVERPESERFLESFATEPGSADTQAKDPP